MIKLKYMNKILQFNLKRQKFYMNLDLLLHKFKKYFRFIHIYKILFHIYNSNKIIKYSFNSAKILSIGIVPSTVVKSPI